MTNAPITPHRTCIGATSAALVANGALSDYDLIKPMICSYERCIAVDGGLLHCQKMKIKPDLIIGDFDSIPSGLLDEYTDTPKLIFPEEKNQSDLDLAVAAANGPEMLKIALFAAMEKQTDHSLANIHLMRRHPGKVVIETERETLFVIEGTQRIECRPGQTLSLIPMGSLAKGVTTKGLKWELNNAALDKNFMSLSNISLRSRVEITVAEGDLICCLAR